MTTARKRTAELLEAQRPDDPWGRVVDLTLITLIFTNVVLIMLETVPEISQKHSAYLLGFEFFSVAVFTLEYALRLWSCVDRPGQPDRSPARLRLRWMVSPLGLIDLMAILPFYVLLLLPGGPQSILLLRIFRGIRLLRVFKLARYSPALRILHSVFYRQANTLIVVTFVMVVLMIMAAWGVYLIERTAQPEQFGSLPDSLWWAVVTITTVGYGDVVPVTPMGKIFGGFISLLGVGMAALPAGILASGFSSEMRRREAVYFREVQRVVVDGHVTEEEQQRVSRLARDLGLSHRDAYALTRDALRDRPAHRHCPHCGADLKPMHEPIDEPTDEHEQGNDK